MIRYSPPAFAPLPYVLGAPSRRPVLGQTFDQYIGLSPQMGDVVRLIFHGATSYLGIHVGMNEKGLLSGLGWFLGIGQGIGALLDILSLVQHAAGTQPTSLPPSSVIPPEQPTLQP